MTTGETLIAFLLGVIAWLLYQIVKQLSYMTGKKLRFSFFNQQIQKFRFKTKPKAKEEPFEKLSN